MYTNSIVWNMGVVREHSPLIPLSSINLKQDWTKPETRLR